MPDDFVVAIASGKGGTGKTTVAANLAWMACHSQDPAQLAKDYLGDTLEIGDNICDH